MSEDRPCPYCRQPWDGAGQLMVLVAVAMELVGRRVADVERREEVRAVALREARAEMAASVEEARAAEGRRWAERGRMGSPVRVRVPQGPGVYIARERAGQVLYVGMTERLAARLGAHERLSAWYSTAASITWHAYESRAAAARAEADAIAELHPRFNLQIPLNARIRFGIEQRRLEREAKIRRLVGRDG